MVKIMKKKEKLEIKKKEIEIKKEKKPSEKKIASLAFI